MVNNSFPTTIHVISKNSFNWAFQIFKGPTCFLNYMQENKTISASAWTYVLQVKIKFLSLLTLIIHNQRISRVKRQRNLILTCNICTHHIVSQFVKCCFNYVHCIKILSLQEFLVKGTESKNTYGQTRGIINSQRS